MKVYTDNVKRDEIIMDLELLWVWTLFIFILVMRGLKLHISNYCKNNLHVYMMSEYLMHSISDPLQLTAQ